MGVLVHEVSVVEERGDGKAQAGGFEGGEDVKCAAVINQLSASGDGSFTCKRSVTQRWPLEARRSVALKQEIQSGRDLVLLLG